MKPPLRKYRKIFTIGIVMYWSLFAFLWGFWGWNDSILFSEWWLFDTIGHALFGVGATITFLLFFRNSRNEWFVFSSKHFLTSSIVSKVIILGCGWEFLEALWDFYHNSDPEHVRAQIAVLDNMIDIGAAALSSFITITFYHRYNEWRWRKYPEERAHEIVFRISRLLEHAVTEISEIPDRRKSVLRRRFKKEFFRAFCRHNMTS